MKKKLWKQWRFWLEVVLGLLVVFFAFAAFSLASEYNVLEKKLNNNKRQDKVTQNLAAYYKRFIDEEHSETAIDFALDPSFGFEFKEPVSFESGKLTMNYAKINNSDMIATTQDYEGKVLVGITFDNTSDDDVIIDARDFFPVLKNGTYPFYDMVFTTGDEEDIEIEDYLVTISPGSSSDFVIVYGTNKAEKPQSINVRMGESLWKN